MIDSTNMQENPALGEEEVTAPMPDTDNTEAKAPEPHEQSAPNTPADSANDGELTINYADIVREDINTLREAFSECRATLTDISMLKNPVRFAALRDLGLSATEAYLATGGIRTSYDSRTHLSGAVPAEAGGGVEIPLSEYRTYKDLFSDMSDSEIRKLYRKVTK